MGIGESVITALFCMMVVFSVLILLWMGVRVFSKIIELVELKDN